MRTHHLIAVAAVAKEAYTFSPRAVAELQRHAVLSTRSTQLLGDLVGDDAPTPVGMQISAILQGNDTAVAGTDVFQDPDVQDTSLNKCNNDTCCKWSQAVQTFKSAYTSGNGCTELARQAIRLGFHDAAAWNVSQSNGGADGSIVLNQQEASRSENRGLQQIIPQMQQWYNQFKGNGLGMADLIQMSAMTATVVCPGGPRIRAFVGRQDRGDLPPDGLIPSPLSDAKTNIALFEAKTFSATDLVALVGAHTVSQQRFVDPSKAGQAQDTTNTVWDVAFYGQVQSPQTPQGVFKFPSDLALSNNSETASTWTVFAGDQNGWNLAFASAYFRMSMLGVKNLNQLTDCTNVLPLPVPPTGGQNGQQGGNQGGGQQGGNQGGGQQGGGQNGGGQNGGGQNGNPGQGGGFGGGNFGGGGYGDTQGAPTS